MKNEMLTLTTEWDKTFPKSDKVDHKKVTFHNRYGITLAADMTLRKTQEENSLLSLSAVRSVRSRSSAAVFTHRRLQSVDS